MNLALAEQITPPPQHKVALVLGGAGYARPFKEDYYPVLEQYPSIEQIQHASVVVFTGGSDVWPGMYGQENNIHPYTMFDIARDKREEAIYNECIHFNIPMVGICRGAQFLNVMNRGCLEQHIEGHGIVGTHPITTSEEEQIDVTSTHHQSMIPTLDGEWLAWAEGKAPNGMPVPEAVLYEDTRCLCVQWHPEYMPEDSRGYQYFRELLARHLLTH